MKTKIILIGFIISFMVGCSSEIDIQNEEAAAEVKQLLEDNINYLNNEDIDGYLSTIVETAHEGTKEETERMFRNYDIDFKLLSSIVFEEEDNKLVLEANQEAKAVSIPEGGEYRDHVSLNHHTFEKIDGEWKITESRVVDINFTD